MADESEIGRGEFFKYAGSLVLIIVAIVGVTFGLMTNPSLGDPGRALRLRARAHNRARGR